MGGDRRLSAYLYLLLLNNQLLSNLDTLHIDAYIHVYTNAYTCMW